MNGCMKSVPFGTESGNGGPVLSFDADLIWRETNDRMKLFPPLRNAGCYFFIVVRLPGTSEVVIWGLE